MSAHDFDVFADAFCTLMGAATPALAAGPAGEIAFRGRLRALEFGVAYDPVSFGNDVVVHVVIGPIAPGREREVLRELLAANVDLRLPQRPAFGLSAETGEVVLRMAHRIGLAGCAESLWEALRILEPVVLQWRVDHGEPHPSFEFEEEEQSHA